MPIETNSSHRFFGLPATWVGWTSDVVALLVVASVFARRLVGGFRGVFALWIIAGLVALGAILGKRERSVLVWIPLVMGLLTALWAVAEILFPH